MGYKTYKRKLKSNKIFKDFDENMKEYEDILFSRKSDTSCPKNAKPPSDHSICSNKN